MKIPSIIHIALIALLFPYSAHANTLSPKPAWCVSVYNIFGEHNCAIATNSFLIRRFWLEESEKIDDHRHYDNYEKIICSDDDRYKMCAFVEGMRDCSAKVPGSQIKKLIRHLAAWCDWSKCGSCPLDRVDGPATYGWFKIDGVADMAGCRGYCKPGEGTVNELFPYIRSIQSVPKADSSGSLRPVLKHPNRPLSK